MFLLMGWQHARAGSDWAKTTIARLQPIVIEKQEQLKQETFSKLKGLGNMVRSSMAAAHTR